MPCYPAEHLGLLPVECRSPTLHWCGLALLHSSSGTPPPCTAALATTSSRVPEGTGRFFPLFLSYSKAWATAPAALKQGCGSRAQTSQALLVDTGLADPCKQWGCSVSPPALLPVLSWGAPWQDPA